MKAKPKAKSTSRASGEQATGKSASRLIDQRIRELEGWRGETLARMRGLILDADPAMTEEWKWMGTPVWSHHGIVCTGESYKKVVKLTFARGAKIPDPAGLFNSSLEGNTRRAIDIHEGETVDAGAFKALVKAAVTLNEKPAKKRETARYHFEGDRMSHGKICYLEIPAKTAEASAEFYSTIFGWKVRKRGDGELAFDDAGGVSGTWVKESDRTPDERTRTYIMVDDIVETLKRIESKGGRVLTRRTDIGSGMGAFAAFADPVGNEFGLYEEPSR